MTKNTSTTAIEAQAKDLAHSLTEAEVLLATRQSELADITTKLTTITKSWDTGDETYTADDLSRAEAGHTRAQALLEAATSNAAQLRRKQINFDLAVAHTMAPLVEAAFRGRVPVEVRIGKAPQTVTGESIPRLVITQAEASSDRQGRLAGEIEVTYLRDDLMSPISTQELKAIADDRQFLIETRSKRIGNPGGDDGKTLDWVKIGVGRCFADRPVIAEDPTEATVKEWARSLAKGLAHAVARNDDPLRYYGEETPNSTGGVLTSSLITASSSKGERTTQVSAELLVQPFRTDVDPGLLMEDVLDRIQGSGAIGLGRCTEAESRIGLYSRAARGRPTDRRVVYLTATFVSASK